MLKPNKNDKNVSPEEMVAFARKQGFAVHLGVAGDLSLLKRLLAGGFPVIVETWFVTPDHGGMGHYRLLVGYNDSLGYFNAFDSYYGPKVTLRYGEVDALGDRMRPQSELQMALKQAQQETQAKPNQAAWFNLGSTLLRLGQPQEAAQAYDRSRQAAPNHALDPRRPADAVNNWPWRMLWYQFGPYEGYFKTGRYREVIVLANDVLGRIDDHEESYYWRGLARKALGNLEGARADFQAALRYRPGYLEPAVALQSLRDQSNR